MVRLVMAGIVSLSLLVAATAQQDSQKTKKKDANQPDQTDRANKLGQEGAAEQTDQNQRVELPESLTQLDLTEEQKKELLAIYRDSDQKSQQLWDRVQDLHRQAISMEAAVIAAARLEGHDHSAHGKQAEQPANADPQPRAKADGSDKDAAEEAIADDEGNKITAVSSPGDNAEKRKGDKNRREDGANATSDKRHDKHSAQESSNADNGKAAGWQGLDGALNIVAIRVAVEQPDGRVREHLLTQPGQNDDSENSGSNKAFHTYQGQLTQVWKDIHEGHEQLVELEASTIVKVEGQLTEEQLQKLDTTQSQASTNPKSQNDDSRR